MDFAMKQTGIDFTKQYGKRWFGVKNTSYYIYPREELIKEDIFPYFVMDGGAFNLINDIFGKVSGDDMLERVMSGELFEYFRKPGGGEYNWERSFAYTGDSGFHRKYEWQIWPQRLYMILPVAQAFLRTGDKKYSDFWLKTVKGWDEAHPYQEFDPEVSYFYTDMVWRDMQVAWRTLSLLHSVFMLQEAPYTPEEWKYIYDFIYLHLKHLHIEAMDRIERQHVQNHVLQIGTALILGATMFPEFDVSADCLKIGIDTVKMNIDGIFPDGGSDEDSPSYSHFIARLYLEAYLLLKNNNLEIPEGLLQVTLKQYAWLYMAITPLGNAPRISDSYSIDAVADLHRVSRLIELELPACSESVLFPDSNMAIIREGNLSLYFDAMQMRRDTGSGHRHLGRPQTLMFYGYSPVLVDGGVTNYDRWELYGRLGGCEYHNVVYCPDFKPGYAQNFCTSGITEYKEGVVAGFCEMKLDDISYRWERKITYTENSVIFEDTAHSEKPIRWKSHFLFNRMDYMQDDEHRLRFLSNNFALTVVSDNKCETLLMPVMNDDNKRDYAIVSECEYFGCDYKNKTVFTFTERNA